MDRLARRLAADLDGSFPDLVRTLQDDLYSGLRRLSGNRSDAEDLTQETFVRAYRALGGYGRRQVEELKLRGWIWTIALNLSRNHARDRARRPQPLEISDQPVDDPEPQDGRVWDRRLSRLAPRARRAVVLRHVVGLSYAEIARALDRPEGTVKADVHRALQQLRVIIEEEEE